MRDLPKYMERRARKGGKESYRVRMPDGRHVHLGSNLGDALIRYNVLRSCPEPVSQDWVAIATEVFDRHKKGAKQRRIAFELTVTDIVNLAHRQEGRCAVTSLPFRMDKPDGLRIRPWAPSIDRLSSTGGYSIENVRLVCAFVNVAMNGFGDSLFSTVLRPLIAAGVAAELQRRGLVFPIGNFDGNDPLDGTSVMQV